MDKNTHSHEDITDIWSDITESRVLSEQEMKQAIEWYNTTCELSQQHYRCTAVNEYECGRHLDNMLRGISHSRPKSDIGSSYLRATRLVLCLRLIESERVLFKLTWG